MVGGITTYILRLTSRDLLDLLLRHLFLLDGGEIIILRKWVVLLFAHDTTLLRAHVPIPVQPSLLLLPLSCV